MSKNSAQSGRGQSKREIEFVTRSISSITIAAAQSDVGRDEIIAGLGELEAYRLVEPLDVISGGDCNYPTQVGYETLNPPLMGWDTGTDARAIAA